MRKDITIEAQARDERGKNPARRLRAQGLAPAVLYGNEKDPISVTISPKEVNKILRSSTGHNTIFNLAIQNGESTPVMIIDWQHDPIRENLLHIDMKRVDPSKRMTVKVPVHIVGESKGVKTFGGLLEVITRDIEVECLPDDIPEAFNVDVTEMMIGNSIRAGALDLGGAIKLISDKESVIVHVVALRAEAAAEEAAATAEPEVIKKGKKEEAGAAPAGGDKKAAAPAAKKK